MNTQPVRILIVEDLPTDAELAQREIKRTVANCVFQQVDTQDDFLAALVKFQPDVIVSDYRMPAFDGMTALKLALHHAPLTPVIILTAEMNEDTAVNCMKAGATNYVIKEHIKRLGQAIVHALEEKQLRRERQQAEKALNERLKLQEQLASIARTVPGLIFSLVLRPDGMIAMPYASPTIEEIFGVRPETVANDASGIFALIPPDDLEHIGYSLLASAQTMTLWHDEYRVCHPRKGIIWVEGRATPHNQADGSILWHGFIQDISERKQIEAALKLSEARLNAIIESAIDAIISVNETYDIVLFNAAAEKTFGCPAVEAIGKPIEHFIPERFHKNHRSYIDAFVSTGQTNRSLDSGRKIIAQRANGEEFPIEATISQIEVAGTKLFTIIHRDITERQQAEEALRQSEERFAKAFHANPSAVSISRMSDGRFLDVNDSFLHLFGYRRDEVIGQTSLSLNLYNQPTDRETLIQQVWQHGRVYNLEMMGRVKSGEIRHVLLSAELLELHHETYALVTIADITKRKRRERELEALATMATALRTAATRSDILRVIVEQSTALLNAEGTALILQETPTADAVVAFAHGTWSPLMGTTMPPGVGISNQVITTGTPYLNSGLTHDPNLYSPHVATPLPIACVPLTAYDQTIGVLWLGRQIVISDEDMRLLVALSDIAANALYRVQMMETLEQRVEERTAELARANERLKELDRLKSKFVTDVSHELRTPMTNLKLYVDLLKRSRPEKHAHYLTIISDQANRQTQLIEDILNLSRLELGADKIQFTAVALNGLISRVISAHHLAAEAQNLSLLFTPHPDIPPVRGESNQLAQVITNLVSNAVSYTPAGKVEIRTGLARPFVYIEVQDTGMGIEEEDLPHLFERFYRGKQATQVRGTGLGLAIVKEIVDIHAGKIEVKSQPGTGSTFRVYLPMT